MMGIRISLCCILLSLSLGIGATPLDELRKSLSKVVSEKSAYIDASGTMSMDARSKSEFRVVSDGSGYLVEMASKSYYCDSESSYLLDDSSMEVSVMDYRPGQASVLSNPLSALVDMDVRFDVKSERYLSDGSYKVEMTPKAGEKEVRYLSIVMDSKGVPSSLAVRISVGSSESTVNADFTSFLYVGGCFSDGFTPDLSELENRGYFINDLR